MKIHFHGATGDVTGSAYHVVTKHASILVDCGMFQGGKKEKAKNRRQAELEGGRLDAVLLTPSAITSGELPAPAASVARCKLSSTGNRPAMKSAFSRCARSSAARFKR